MHDIDAKRKQFLWAGTEKITGAKCKVNWVRAARSKENGGLGILHLGKFTRALRLMWLWRAWNPERKPWVGNELPCSETDQHLFAAATTITIGNGEKISFWNSAWIQGLRPKDLAPSVYKISKKKSRTVQEALFGNTWIKDLDILHPSFSPQLFALDMDVRWNSTYLMLKHLLPYRQVFIVFINSNYGSSLLSTNH